MPRNLGRLRFRVPKPVRPLNLVRVQPNNRQALEQEVTNHVVELSKPTATLNLSTVTDPKWKKHPGNRGKKLRRKPHTLRDIVDPQGRKKHGEVIYVFRSTKTNQVIYSLSEMLDNYHLDQLPFMGKHSKPPALRPDEWVPHCVALFPSAAQGQQAFRALREYRKLHEYHWAQTNPEYRLLSPATRMKKLMDQVANTSADLAAVLTLQERRTRSMHAQSRTYERKATEFMDKKWSEINELVNTMASRTEKPPADDPKWLEHQITSLTAQLAKKHNQNEESQRRLTKAKRSHESRLKKIRFAPRKAQQFKDMQEQLAKKATLANAEGAEEKLQKLKDDIEMVESELAGSAATPRSEADINFNRDTLRTYKQELAILNASFAAKQQHDSRDHYVARSILPPELRKQPPVPFTMDIEIKWADLQDALWADGKWPAAVQQDVLPVKELRQSVTFLSQEEYEQTVNDEVVSIIDGMEKEAVRQAEEAAEAEWAEAKRLEEENKGIFGLLGRMNPFRRAET
ncbi:hypothetical protein P280DRAFT_466606 [Massarina eburnea CBS 473.64]|uniref:Large ribosomal subunit protein mL67 n=1 Tax=Massarina eburnea CBS 473.64 TaxID=1395130 RepID=A0A6A6S9K2_9PLEO|nr:hypothetical protein P280DRAFT_466606 [Massarina eburnea CBS 473.64]